MIPQRRYQDVAEIIRARISELGVAPGARLDTERQWSQALGVSRSMVRDAMIMLEIQGLVEVRQGSGIYLREQQDTHGSSDAVFQDDIGPFELLQARQLLESTIAAVAADQVTKSDIVKMRRALDTERAYIEAGGGPDYSSDEEFHRLIGEATQNSVLAATVTELWSARDRSPMWAQLHARIFNQDYRTHWLDDHEQVFNALRARNPEAARQAMWQHLDHVRETLLTVSDVDDPAFDGYLFQPAPKAANIFPPDS